VTIAHDRSSVAVGFACLAATATTSVHSPITDNSRSDWWIPCPIVGPPPSTSHRPRHGTVKYSSGRNHSVWHTAVVGRPSRGSPASPCRRAAPLPNRCWNTVAKNASAGSAAASIASSSARLSTGGFSHSTEIPRDRHAIACGACSPGGVHSVTRSGSSRSSSSSSVGYTEGTDHFEPNAASAAASTSVAATIRTRSSCAASASAWKPAIPPVPTIAHDSSINSP
jgi:hypothetical protein